MKKLSLVIALGLLAACSSQSDKELSGIYQGTLPCGDCEKIEAKLILKQDKTYQYHTVYHKGNIRYPFLEVGTYKWDRHKQNTIRLQVLKNQRKDILADIMLKVSENEVELCDAEGNSSSIPQHYKLRRISP
ncbi:MAG: copper resistance protein NlpE N-terminal domain-containing protein [Pasteurellaceae bacterium]|nr:copper resistance protein NlpE N-terminal domain-containing protein [Pasteurellaceae bacterium]